MLFLCTIKKSIATIGTFSKSPWKFNYTFPVLIQRLMLRDPTFPIDDSFDLLKKIQIGF